MVINRIKQKKYIKYLIPSIITFIILGIIFYFNDLYPFGGKPLVQVDADYLYIPVLYKIYDFLHYGGSLIYNDLGLGNSIYGSLIIQGSLFSPLNLLLYFVNKAGIIDFFGIFIIIKLCLLSFTSYIYINNKYNKINYFYKVFFSVLYTFNGFIILNYFNEIWLDIVILFPLLVMYLDKILNDKKELGYTIILASCFVINFYFSVFLVIFILFYSLVNIYLSKKKNIKDIIFKLGKSSIIAFLISSFSSIPLLYQILISDRFNGEVYTEMFSSISMKSLYILFSPLFIILFCKLIIKYKEDKINIYKYFLLVVLYIIPLIVDPVNALMHGGSYWSFPYRYGFITSFILMDACLYYLSKFSNEKKSKINFISISSFVLIVWIGVVGVFLNIKYRSLIINEGILLDIENETYIHIIYMVIVVFLMNLLIYFIKDKKFKYITLSLVGLYSLFLFSSWTIYYNSGYFLCINAEGIRNNIDMPKDGRYKVEYTTYTPDYGYIFDVDTLDNWIHIVPNGFKEHYANLGYYPSGTSVYSYGGTIFSDWLLNFKYLFSKDYNKQYDDMFNKVGEDGNKYLYKYNYSDSYGIVFNDFDKLLDYSKADNKFDYQNMIYHNLFNTNDDIIRYENYDLYDDEYIELDYNISKSGYLYFYSYDSKIVNYISINDNNIYDYDDYIKYLGLYDNDIKIKIYLKDDNTNIDFSIGFIEKDKIEKLNSDVIYKKNKYYVNVDEDNKYLFLPINNINGIHVYNNDKKVDTLKYLDNFICIKLNKGKNVISVKYKLPFLSISIILSIIGLLLLIFNNKIKSNKYLLFICYWSYNIIVLGVYIYYYFYSFIKYLL